jgi:hypothetical protein
MSVIATCATHKLGNDLTTRPRRGSTDGSGSVTSMKVEGSSISTDTTVKLDHRLENKKAMRQLNVTASSVIDKRSQENLTN